jgi:putative SOS response-associated peptidase YedK
MREKTGSAKRKSVVRGKIVMCGRYRRTTSEEELARLYHIPIPPQRDLPISWNIAPSQDVLVIRHNPKVKQRSLDALRRGLIPYCAKDPKIAYKTINARAETVDTAPSYRGSVQEAALPRRTSP